MKIHYVIGYAILGFLVLVAPGCQTMSTKAETVGADGAKQSLVQKCSVPPFGKLAEGSGQMTTHLGADGSYDVATGQAARGVDNTAQAVALQSFLDFAAKVTGSYLGYLQTRPAPTPDTTQTDFMRDVLPMLITPRTPVAVK